MEDFPIKSVLADNASCFISHEWTSWCSRQNIHLRRINCYSPQVNLAERVMTVLANHLRIQLQGQKHSKWLQYVPDIEKSVNEIIQSTTGVPPITLMHGTVPSDSVAKRLMGNKPPLNEQERRDLQKLANERTQQACERRDSRMPEPTKVKKGDIVKVHAHNLSSKTDKKNGKIVQQV